MNCLVIAATSLEISPFIRRLKAGDITCDADVLITGIGLTATTYALSHHLRIKRPDIIIQAGIAGCFNRSVPLGTVFTVKKETFADLGVMEDKTMKTIFDLKLAKPGQAPFTNGWLVNKTKVPTTVKLRKVTGISVNEITSSRQRAALYMHKYAPVLESMEGAALHYTALMENIPFVQLRAVSNYVTVRDKRQWNMKESIQHLNDELINLLTAL